MSFFLNMKKDENVSIPSHSLSPPQPSSVAKKKTGIKMQEFILFTFYFHIGRLLQTSGQNSYITARVHQRMVARQGKAVSYAPESS